MSRPVPTRVRSAAVLALVLGPACSGPREAPPTAVTGRVFLPRGAGVPAGTVLELRVLDVTPVEESELGAAELRGPLASPVSYALPFDWGDVDPAHSYALRARVRAERRDGGVLFATATDTAVITRGHPRRVDLTLVALEPAQIPR